jgi:hypothetical protein
MRDMLQARLMLSLGLVVNARTSRPPSSWSKPETSKDVIEGTVATSRFRVVTRIEARSESGQYRFIDAR